MVNCSQDDLQNQSFVVVGYVKDAHGIKGEIFVRLPSGESEWLDKIKEIRLKKLRSIKTFCIERIRPHKDGLVIQLIGVKNRNQAEELRGYEFELPETMLQSQPGESIYLREVLGFEVVDQTLGSLGPIVSFDTNGFQDLIVLHSKNGEIKNREVLVPFIKPFIIKMDFQNRKIEMNLPEGLIEV